MSGKVRGAHWMPTRAAALTLTLALAMPAAQARMADGAEIAGTAGAAAVHDEPDTASATSVKAGFLYKFLGYVDFPGGPLDPGAPYVVGVVGAEEIATELTRLTAGRLVNNHAVVVRKMQGVDPSGGLHLLLSLIHI